MTASHSENIATDCVLAQVRLKCAPPVADGWLPPGAARPPARGREESILELRESGDGIQLALIGNESGLLWQETLATRAEAEATAQRLFHVKPEDWQAPCDDVTGATTPAAQRSFTVDVTRMTRAGNLAFGVALMLFSVIMIAGIFASMALAEAWAESDGGQTTLTVAGALISMVLAMLIGFGLPFWFQIRFFGQDEFSATARMDVGPDGIDLPPLGHLPWAGLNAIDQVNTENGEAEAVILLSDAWGKLMFRASGSNSNVELAGKLLDAMLTFWRPDEVQAEHGASLKLFRLLPINRWWHETLYVLGGVVSVGLFFTLMATGERDFLVMLASASVIALISWALIALMPGHFWSLTSANRVRAYFLQGDQLIDERRGIRIDLSRASLELVHWRRPALELDYLCITSPDQPTLQLAAFDSSWDEFIAAVRPVAGNWQESLPENPTLPEGMRDMRG